MSFMVCAASGPGALAGCRLASRVFYRLFSILAKTELPRGAGDFRLLDRRVVNAFNACTERSRFNNGLYAWLGFRRRGPVRC